jgi:hypothetical protein
MLILDGKRIYHVLFSACFRTFAAPLGPRAPQRAGRQAGTGRSIGVASTQRRAWTARLWHRASIRVASGSLTRVDSPPATTNNAAGKCGKPFNMRHIGMIYRRMIALQRGLFRRPYAERLQNPGGRR